MAIFELNTIFPLVGAGVYTLLLLVPFLRRGQRESQIKWFLAFIVTAVLWNFALYFTSDIRYPPNLPVKVLMIGTLLLGVSTAVYVDALQQRWWLILSAIAIIASLLVDLLRPAQSFIIPYSQLFASFTDDTVSYGTLASYLTWFGVNSLILSKTWHEYRQTRFPWHANRLLFWAIALAVTLIGEAMILSKLEELLVIGQVVRFLGVAFLTYAVSSYRLFDVRSRVQRTLTSVLTITLIALLPVIGIYAVLRIMLEEIPRMVLIAIIVATIFFIYQPIIRLFERISSRYLRITPFNPRSVIQQYSQAISRTLDMQELASQIIVLLNELFDTSRGSLMLVTNTENGYEITPVPGLEPVPLASIILPTDSQFIQVLLTEPHQPLLQYELDFNPDYVAIRESARDWLKSLAMEAFVPIIESGELVGLIAIGPKQSGFPYQPGELALIQTLAAQTVIALQNARLYSELDHQNEQISSLNRDLHDQNERLVTMDRVKTDFITIASHELRTPLTQVKGYADILSAMNEENSLTRKQTHEIINHINRATLRLETLITAMLDASQLDVDELHLTYVKTQLDTIVRLASEPLIQALRERQITLTLEGLETLPDIQADFKRLVQAFSNLLGNAVKYTPDHGSITISGFVVPSNNEEEQFVEVVVADSGIGIDPQYHELIFEKFFRVGDPQLHSTGTTKFKGAGPGLGLPITRGVIENHGGRIWVESEKEDEERLPGSRFHILLPVKPPRAPDLTDEEEGTETAVRPSYLVG